jgi:NAD(P)-dependent dehydrogenase (short-subunit alcohol dehydrogenase family)
MSLFDAFAFKGKRVLVVGGSTGMGEAVTALVKDAGADVVMMDFVEKEQDGVTFIKLNLSDRDSIDSAVAACGGPIHALFACAGVADGTPGIERINFIGHRYLIDKMVDAGNLPRGSAIGFISSAAGMGWEANLDELNPYLDITDWDEATKWCVDHNRADYMWSKMSINAYVTRECQRFMKAGIRINSILPGPTNTPLAQANAEMWLGFGADYREEIGIESATPLEQAYPLVFLCSSAASGVSGIVMMTDAGYMAAAVSGTWPEATPVIGFLRGKIY